MGRDSTVRLTYPESYFLHSLGSLGTLEVVKDALLQEKMYPKCGHVLLGNMPSRASICSRWPLLHGTKKRALSKRCQQCEGSSVLLLTVLWSLRMNVLPPAPWAYSCQRTLYRRTQLPADSLQKDTAASKWLPNSLYINDINNMVSCWHSWQAKDTRLSKWVRGDCTCMGSANTNDIIKCIPRVDQ